MTALLSPSMPMQMAPERLTFAFSMRTMRRPGFLSLALIAAIGPPVPPPMTSRSVSMVSVLLCFTVIGSRSFEWLVVRNRRCDRARDHFGSAVGLGRQLKIGWQLRIGEQLKIRPG